VCGSVCQCVAVCYSVFRCVRVYVCVCGCVVSVLTKFTTKLLQNLLQCKVDERTVCGRVWQSVAVCYSMLECVGVYVCVCGCIVRVVTKFTTNCNTNFTRM